jgi:hypothetical protein
MIKRPDATGCKEPIHSERVDIYIFLYIYIYIIYIYYIISMNTKFLRSWVQNLATIAIKMLSIYFNSLSMPTLENKNITIHQLPFSKHRTPSLPCFPASNLQSFHRAGTKRVELLHRPTIAGTGTSIGAICGICAAVTEGIAAFAALKGVQPLKGIPRRRRAGAVHLKPPGKGWWKPPGNPQIC